MEKIDTALTQTRDAVQQMSLWSNSLAKRGAHVPKLSEMSFKKGIEGMTQQLVQILEESQRLYRKDDLVQWRGTFERGQYFYNTDFDAKTGWQVQAARGIQQVLISLQFYIDLWRSLFHHVHTDQQWTLYDDAMKSVSALVFVEDKTETVSNALAGLDLRKTRHLKTLLEQLLSTD